jgi:Lipocalin-like domain
MGCHTIHGGKIRSGCSCMMRQETCARCSYEPIVQLMLKATSLRGNPEEVKSTFEGFQAYLGTYEVNDEERMDIHHVIGCSFPNWEGTDQIQFFEFSGKNLSFLRWYLTFH